MIDVTGSPLASDAFRDEALSDANHVVNRYFLGTLHTFVGVFTVTPAYGEVSNQPRTVMQFGPHSSPFSTLTSWT